MGFPTTPSAPFEEREHFLDGAATPPSKASKGGDIRLTIELPLPLSDGFRDRREVASRKAETNEAGGSAIAG